MVFEFLLAFTKYLVESLCDDVADPLQVLRLLYAENRERVLRKSGQNSLVAKGLVAHALQVSVLFEF